MTKVAACESVITDPTMIEAEIAEHRAKAEAEFGGPVDALTRSISHVITIQTGWTLKPPPEAEDAYQA